MPLLVSLENLTQEMITAKPVLNHLGQLLLGKGVQLSGRHVTVLKTWGIEKILVEGGESEATPEVNEGIRNRAWMRINERIQWQPQNPWEKEIIQVAVQQEIRRSLEES